MKDISEATREEREALKLWSLKKKNAQNIRKVVYKNFKYLTSFEMKFQNEAMLINDMFLSYDSSQHKNEPIYRGKVFYLEKPSDKSSYAEFVTKAYNAYTNKTSFIPDTVFRSATLDIKEALKFSEMTNKAKRSILVTYTKRVSSELDISLYSAYGSEKEILINGNIRYKVVKLELNKDKDIYIELEEEL